MVITANLLFLKKSLISYLEPSIKSSMMDPGIYCYCLPQIFCSYGVFEVELLSAWLFIRNLIGQCPVYLEYSLVEYSCGCTAKDSKSNFVSRGELGKLTCRQGVPVSVVSLNLSTYCSRRRSRRWGRCIGWSRSWCFS